MFRNGEPAAEEVVGGPDLVTAEEIANGARGLFVRPALGPVAGGPHLELHGRAGFLLRDDGAVLRLAAGRLIAHFEPNEIAAAQLSVDRHAETRQLAHVAPQFKACADGPHLLHLSAGFWPVSLPALIRPGEPFPRRAGSRQWMRSLVMVLRLVLQPRPDAAAQMRRSRSG